jgi:hypothetical protein
MAKTLSHHPWRTWVKALFGMALTTAGFILHGVVSGVHLQGASIILFASGLLLTRHYGVQAGQLAALGRENRPYRLEHGTVAIFLRLVFALAAAASCAWIWLEAKPADWIQFVPIVGFAVAALLAIHYFRELILEAVADVKPV